MDNAAFTRSPNNPLILSKNLPYQANAVFNAGAADLGEEVVLLLRVESSSGRSHLIVARSKDGVRNWQVEDRALLHPEEGPSYEVNGAEDCRITWVEELKTWVLAYVAVSDYGPGVALAKTTDFRTVERIGLVIPPDDKNAAPAVCCRGQHLALLFTGFGVLGQIAARDGGSRRSLVGCGSGRGWTPSHRDGSGLALDLPWCQTRSGRSHLPDGCSPPRQRRTTSAHRTHTPLVAQSRGFVRETW
jgi:hypothetical protein